MSGRGGDADVYGGGGVGNEQTMEQQRFADVLGLAGERLPADGAVGGPEEGRGQRIGIEQTQQGVAAMGRERSKAQAGADGVQPVIGNILG